MFVCVCVSVCVRACVRASLGVCASMHRHIHKIKKNYFQSEIYLLRHDCQQPYRSQIWHTKIRLAKSSAYQHIRTRNHIHGI